jgi:PAS domain S-box-containing protein
MQAEVERLHQQIATLEQRLEKRTEERNLFQTLTEYAPDIICVAHLDYTLIYVNPTFCALTGYTNAADSPRVTDLYAEPAEKLNAILQQVIEEGAWQGVLTCRRRDSTTFIGQVTLFVIRDEKGHPLEMVSIARDITDKVQMEEALWQNRSLLQGLLDHSPSSIAVKDLNGRIILVNQRYRDMLRLSNEQIVGKTEAELFPPETVRIRRQHDQQVRETGQTVEDEEMLDLDDGFHMIVSINFPIYDNLGNMTAIGGISHDITRIKLAEEENTYLQDQVIVAQQVALNEATTPICPITDDVVLMPLVGAIDQMRAQQVMSKLLNAIVQQRVKVAILDISGVPEIDEHIAGQLIQTARAVQLLGATPILTGINPAMAQTLITLGIDLSGIETRGTLQAGIGTALQRERLPKHTAPDG